MTMTNLIDFTVREGCDETQVREGSMPAWCTEFIAAHIPHGGVGIYVGVFVGVGLTYLMHLRRQRFVLAIDPGMSHRGIDRPLDVAHAMFEQYGIAGDINVMQAFSALPTPPNDGLPYAPRVNGRPAGVGALVNLQFLGMRAADWILLDGGHGTDNLRREVHFAPGLLKPGGLLIMDDVDANWQGIQEVWNSLGTGDWEHVGHNGRIGIVRLKDRLAVAHEQLQQKAKA